MIPRKPRIHKLPHERRDDDPRVTLSLCHHQTTSAATLLSVTLRDKARWVPNHLVTDNGDGTFTMFEWLAADRGLL